MAGAIAAFLMMIAMPIIWLFTLGVALWLSKWLYKIIAVIMGDKSVIHEFDCREKKESSFWKELWYEMTFNYRDKTQRHDNPPPQEYLDWRGKQKRDDPPDYFGWQDRKDE